MEVFLYGIIQAPNPHLSVCFISRSLRTPWLSSP